MRDGNDLAGFIFEFAIPVVVGFSFAFGFRGDLGGFRFVEPNFHCDIRFGRSSKADTHVSDDGVEASGVEGRREDGAPGKFRQSKERARVHHLDMIDIALQGHLHFDVTLLQFEDFDSCSRDGGDATREIDLHFFKQLGCPFHSVHLGPETAEPPDF